MAMLKEASIKDLKRLLELFPVAKLRENWSKVGGKKGELSHAVAKRRHRDELVRFIDDNFSCCKQHVYAFWRVKPLRTLPTITINDAEMVLDAKGKHALHLARMQYKVILSDPLEQASLEFLWPFLLDITRGYLVIRFVVLEKNVSSRFGGRKAYIESRSIQEESILQQVTSAFNGELKPADLHKGVKKLWDRGFMDATRTRYKKPISTASETMDEEMGIKEKNPELYRVVKKSTLFNTLFRIKPEKDCSVSAFWTDPSKGTIDFPRYSEKNGDTDRVIEQILKNN